MDATFGKVGNSYNMEQLRTLNDPNVLYRMPHGFPLMDYFNPPNNCFSCNVGQKHTINLKHALDLCDILVSKENKNNDDQVLVEQINFIHVTTKNTFDKMNHWQSFSSGQMQMSLDKLKKKTDIKAICNCSILFAIQKCKFSRFPPKSRFNRFPLLKLNLFQLTYVRLGLGSYLLIHKVHYT